MARGSSVIVPCSLDTITRYGPSIRIGVENAVALDIDIGEQTHFALFGAPSKAA